jgi:chromosome segregation ATPase
VTKADREILRTRLRDQLKERGTSARAAERAIGIATGTLSKIYGGKMTLSHRLLHELSALLKIEPEVLIHGTAFEHLLHTAVTTPESEELARLRAETEGLRAETRAAEEALAAARRDLDTLRHEQAEMAGKIAALEREASGKDAELARMHTELERLRAAASTAEHARRAALAQADQERQQRAAALAKVAEFEKNATAWRTYGLERGQRVTQLEAYIQQQHAQMQTLQSKAADSSGTVAGTALGGLLGFALGALANRGGDGEA